MLAYNLFLCGTGGAAPFYGNCICGTNNELRNYTAGRHPGRHMRYLLNEPWLLGLLVAIALAATIEVGRRTAAYIHIHDDTNRKEQMVAIRDGLFVLVSLLLGFTLALAVPRFTERRSLLVEEAISIETTYLRAGMLPQSYRDDTRDLLRHYIDARLDFDNAGLDAVRFNEATNRSKQIQAKLWADAVAVAQTDRTAIADSYVNSLTETTDLHDKRIAALENRIPISIWFLILSVSIIAMFTRGLTLTRRFWLTLVLAPVTIAIVVALVADLDSPSTGLIRLDQRATQRLKAEFSAEP